MQSSQEGRLGLQKIKYFKWKGRTFQQVSSMLQKNEKPSPSSHDIFKSQPLKHYRREVASITPQYGNSRISTTISLHHDAPGGATNTTLCKGTISKNEFTFDESKTARPCGALDSTYIDNHTLSQADNARRRVRSAGMNRTKFDSSLNTRANNYRSSSEYLHSRNKTFKQNQFNSLRVENSESSNNVYSSTSIQYCGNNDFIPVYYKPNNEKFANQGAVDASTRLSRLKYDTITDSASKMVSSFGKHTANALAYGVPANGYTIKDKYGYPNTRTPVFKDNQQTCSSTSRC